MPDDALDTMLHKFWDLQTLGVKEDEKSPVMSHFLEHVKVAADGRVEVSVPWKNEIKQYLPVNYHQAAIRFEVLKRKLNQPGQEKIKEKYEKVIEDQLSSGIIEKVPEQDESVFVNDQLPPDDIDFNTAIIGTNEETKKVKCYIPQFGVVKRGSDKVRVVSDASSQACSGAITLNEAIHCGDSLLADLADTLMTYRLYNVTVNADIRHAYLNIGLNPADRDAFRFLWYEGDKTVEYRFARVPFGIVVSSFLLHAVLQWHLGKELESQPELLEKIIKSLYVDDLLSGAEDVKSVLKLRELIEEVLGKIGMKLHGWNSNSRELREQWGAAVGEIVHVLGLLWDPEADT